MVGRGLQTITTTNPTATSRQLGKTPLGPTIMHTASSTMHRASMTTTDAISEKARERHHAEAAEHEAAKHSQVMHIHLHFLTSLSLFPTTLATHAPVSTVTKTVRTATNHARKPA